MSQKPNILLVVIDCGRSDKWLGPGRCTVTPSLDRLASRGISLPATIVEKPCTTPSFATLLTGRYSPRHGVHLVWGYRLPAQVPMLTEVLARHGYHTYAEASGPLLPEMGLARGFERYEWRAPCDYLHTAWGEQFRQRLRNGHYQSPWFLMLHAWELHPHRQVAADRNKPEFGRNEYERAISSLDVQLGRVFEAAGEDTVIVVTGDHGEKTVDETYREGTAVSYARDLLGIEQAGGMTPFSIAKWAGPSVLQELCAQCRPLMRGVQMRELRGRLNQSRWARLRDRLRLLWLTPMVFLHDLRVLGMPLRLTQMLRRRGLLDEQRARHKVERLAKIVGTRNLLDMQLRMWASSYLRNLTEGHMVHVYDFLVRVPLVIRWSGRLPAGVVMPRMVRQPDIVPTLLDLLGISPAEAEPIDGRSFRALLDGQPWEPPAAYLSVTGLPADLEIHGVRTERHKYTYCPHNPDLPAELYDLAADPGEQHNLAAAEPELAARMRTQIGELMSAGGETSVEMMTVADEEREQVEQRLRDLGYLA